MKTVTIVIPTYKRSDYVVRVIENALQQDYTSFDILIIDDNGIGTEHQKKTCKVLKPLVEKYSNVTYLALPQNLGACKARNMGIQNASGDFIAFLDDDDFWHPHFLSEMMNIINCRNADIVYSDFYRMDEYGIFYNKNEKKYEGDIQDYLLQGWCPASTSLFCIKRSVLLKYGCFNETLRNLEEYELWLRLSADYHFYFCDKKMVVKTEFQHEQLTNNFDSRIDAWLKMKELNWVQGLPHFQYKMYQDMIDANIKSELYHRELYSSKFNVKVNYLFNTFGIVKVINIIVSKLVGLRNYNRIKRFFLKFRGLVKYVSKKECVNIQKIFRISIKNILA